jgi:hypothetical protein
MSANYRLEVSTTLFVSVHGKQPAGRGTWAFRFIGPSPEPKLHWVRGGKLYSDAKREARAAAPAGTRMITVQP